MTSILIDGRELTVAEYAAETYEATCRACGVDPVMSDPGQLERVAGIIDCARRSARVAS